MKKKTHIHKHFLKYEIRVTLIIREVVGAERGCSEQPAISSVPVAAYDGYRETLSLPWAERFPLRLSYSSLATPFTPKLYTRTSSARTFDPGASLLLWLDVKEMNSWKNCTLKTEEREHADTKTRETNSIDLCSSGSAWFFRNFLYYLFITHIKILCAREYDEVWLLFPSGFLAVRLSNSPSNFARIMCVEELVSSSVNELKKIVPLCWEPTISSSLFLAVSLILFLSFSLPRSRELPEFRVQFLDFIRTISPVGYLSACKYHSSRHTRQGYLTRVWDTATRRAFPARAGRFSLRSTIKVLRPRNVPLTLGFIETPRSRVRGKV